MIIQVKAAPGQLVVFPLDVIAAPGRRHLRLEGDAVAMVDGDHRFVRRAIRCSSLIPVETGDKERPTPRHTKRRAEVTEQ